MHLIDTVDVDVDIYIYIFMLFTKPKFIISLHNWCTVQNDQTIAAAAIL